MREPSWFQLVVDSLHKIGVGFISLCLTVAGMLFAGCKWFVREPFRWFRPSEYKREER